MTINVKRAIVHYEIMLLAWRASAPSVPIVSLAIEVVDGSEQEGCNEHGALAHSAILSAYHIGFTIYVGQQYLYVY